MLRDQALVILSNLRTALERVRLIKVGEKDPDAGILSSLVKDLESYHAQFSKILGREDKARLQERIAELQAEIAILEAGLE